MCRGGGGGGRGGGWGDTQVILRIIGLFRACDYIVVRHCIFRGTKTGPLISGATHILSLRQDVLARFLIKWYQPHGLEYD